MPTAAPSKLHWLTPIASAILLGLGFLAYGATGHDDAHINFWSAWTLLEHGEILNYNGERVEQTTNLLQDLLTAALHVITRLDLVTSGFLVDIVAAWGCCWLSTLLARRLSPALVHWTIWLLASTSSFMLWSFGGMGATLAAFCLLATVASWTQWIACSAPGLRLTLTLLASCVALTLERPEMPLIAIALAIWLLVFNIHHADRRKRCLQLLAMSFLAGLLLFAWQAFYFSSWLPVPALAKQGGKLASKLNAGYLYIVLNSVMNPVLLLSLFTMPFYVWWHYRKKNNHTSINTTINTPINTTLFCLLAGATSIYTGFIWAAGGDWMQAARFFVPILPTAILMLLATLTLIPWRWIAHVALATLCGFQFFQQYKTTVPQLSHGIPAWTQFHLAPQHQRYSLFEKLNQEHLRDMAVIDHLAQIIPPLHTQLQRPVRLISGQAGMVFYYTAQRFGQDVVFRDLRGLVEGSLSLCPALADIKRGSQGLFWGYADFFAHLPQLQTDCGITAPDIIYDINDMSQKMGKTLEPLGYTLIHQERGFLVENHTALPYNRLLSPNMIFVRNELLAYLPSQEKTVIDYNALPLQSRF